MTINWSEIENKVENKVAMKIKTLRQIQMINQKNSSQ